MHLLQLYRGFSCPSKSSSSSAVQDCTQKSRNPDYIICALVFLSMISAEQPVCFGIEVKVTASNAVATTASTKIEIRKYEFTSGPITDSQRFALFNYISAHPLQPDGKEWTISELMAAVERPASVSVAAVSVEGDSPISPPCCVAEVQTDSIRVIIYPSSEASIEPGLKALTETESTELANQIVEYLRIYPLQETGEAWSSWPLREARQLQGVSLSEILRVVSDDPRLAREHGTIRLRSDEEIQLKQLQEKIFSYMRLYPVQEDGEEWSAGKLQKEMALTIAAQHIVQAVLADTDRFFFAAGRFRLANEPIIEPPVSPAVSVDGGLIIIEAAAMQSPSSPICPASEESPISKIGHGMTSNLFEEAGELSESSSAQNLFRTIDPVSFEEHSGGSVTMEAGQDLPNSPPTLPSSQPPQPLEDPVTAHIPPAVTTVPLTLADLIFAFMSSHNDDAPWTIRKLRDEMGLTGKVKSGEVLQAILGDPRFSEAAGLFSLVSPVASPLVADLQAAHLR